ncbi:hypothetical protein G6321_00001110 (plasmid) [Bradyrhizobium barranii subsp. barranii]|uniref:Uncharacterized protein n=1 Tax=Bradyrhizobium barranii subsp. barranii TaxID=2823807 RepID=A0A7Z0QLT7_9BRAD|nr:hypothetical protein [Bradyrhizobium barranii]UGX89719.1 hypothetical protein G6321_00001110 [Bradyrhizobium barranii subsp. barranii]
MSHFFFRQVTFRDGVATVSIGDDDQTHMTIIFENVRTLIVFKEGDFFEALSKYEHERIIPGPERTLGVFRIVRFPILQKVLEGRLDEERPTYYWVSTPDECIEIAGFSAPHVVPSNNIGVGSK